MEALGIFGQVFSPSPQVAQSPVRNLGTNTRKHFRCDWVLAAILGAVLAYRPRRRVLGLQTESLRGAKLKFCWRWLLSVDESSSADNAARAFGIFAAVSVVRFATNIRDPKEITVLLISLAIGLGTGVGRWAWRCC
jgi:hypothetical protein